MSDEDLKTGAGADLKKTGNPDGDKNTELNYQDIFNKGFKAADAKRKTELEKLQNQLDELSTFKAEIDKAKEEEEHKKLKEKEQFDEVLKNIKKTHSEEKNKIETERNQLKEQLKSRIIKTELYKVVSEVDVIPEAINDVVNLAYDTMEYSVETIDGRQVEKVFPANDGTPMMDEKTGEPLSVKGYFEKLLDKKPFFKKSLSQGGSGTQHKTGLGGQVVNSSSDAIHKGLNDLLKRK